MSEMMNSFISFNWTVTSTKFQTTRVELEQVELDCWPRHIEICSMSSGRENHLQGELMSSLDMGVLIGTCTSRWHISLNLFDWLCLRYCVFMLIWLCGWNMNFTIVGRIIESCFMATQRELFSFSSSSVVRFSPWRIINLLRRHCCNSTWQKQSSISITVLRIQ